MTSAAVRQVWAQAACFDELFYILAREIWIYFFKIRRCTQFRDSRGEQFLKNSPVPKIEGNGENLLCIICELGLLCPNAHAGVSCTITNKDGELLRYAEERTLVPYPHLPGDET